MHLNLDEVGNSIPDPWTGSSFGHFIVSSLSLTDSARSPRYFDLAHFRHSITIKGATVAYRVHRDSFPTIDP